MEVVRWVVGSEVGLEEEAEDERFEDAEDIDEKGDRDELNVGKGGEVGDEIEALGLGLGLDKELEPEEEVNELVPRDEEVEVEELELELDGIVVEDELE